jgi:hypothetical protein
MTTAALAVSLLLVAGLATPTEVNALLDRLGGADLILTSDPKTARPVRVLLAARVASGAENVRQVVTSPSSYRKAMPSFRRVEVVSRRTPSGESSDLQVAWELDVPLWNLEGRLWLRPRNDGVDLELAEGDFAPGLFHLSVAPASKKAAHRSTLIIEGHANVRDANMATRQLVQRSALAEPAMTLAAAYVMLKSLARLAETGSTSRPKADIIAANISDIDNSRFLAAAALQPPGAGFQAVVRSRADGRLARVEAFSRLTEVSAERASFGLPFAALAALPGWKKIELQREEPHICTDPAAPCYAVDADLPLFSLGGIWKLRRKPWRARMVSGDREGALLGIDVVSTRAKDGAILVLTEQPRLDRAGYVARKLIAAEPFLEHGLALALTMVDAVSLATAMSRL